MKARWLGLLLLAVACDEAAGNDGPDGSFPQPPTGTDAGYPLPIDSGVGTGVGTGTVTGNGTGTGTGTGGAASGLPCDVAQIVTAKCGLCHTEPPKFGATMALTKQAHFTAASTIVAGSTVAQRVKARIADAARPMPPVGQPTLTDAETATLNAWLDQGAPTSTAACTGAGTGTGTGTGTGPDTSVPTGDNAPYAPPDSECDFIQELRAHGGQTPTDTSPFSAPNGGDHYEIFYFKPKWTDKVHTIRIDPIIDNAAVLHHWLLYQEEGNGGGDGTHRSDIGLQSGSSQLLSGWAPGNDSIPLPKHVGIQTIAGPNARFGIEIHYNTNANPANRADRSGARICVTKALRQNEASVHWLGTQNIILFPGAGSATGRCTPTVKGGQSHIIAHSPHMHLTGRHLKTTVKRKATGAEEILYDAPFSFDDQRIYPVFKLGAPAVQTNGEQIILPGDVLTTTCSFQSTGLNSFGPDTSAEMCYNFVVAWPAGSLAGSTTGIVGGKNTCIDPGT